MTSAWNAKPLSEVARIYNGNSVSDDDKRNLYSGIAEGLPYIGTKEIGFDHSIEYESGVRIPKDRLNAFKRAPANTVLVCAEGGSAGRKIAHTNHEICFGNKLFAIAPLTGLDSRFAFYFCLTEQFGAQFRGAMAGLIGGVSLSKFKTIQILIPPLPEQLRVASILEEALGEINAARISTERSLENIRQFFTKALDSAIQGQLIPSTVDHGELIELLSQIATARRKASSKIRAKAQDLNIPREEISARPMLPSGWVWAQLDSLTIGITDGVHKTPRYVSDGIPFVTVRNLTAGPGISFADLNYITREDHAEYIKRTNPEKGDILITKDGTIGVVRLIETDLDFSIFVSVALIKPALRELGPYLAYALRSSWVQSQIVPQGTALKHLYLVDLRRLKVPLPSMPEQSRIVARLDELDFQTQRLSGIYESKLAALDELKKSLLHQAFTGQLTAKSTDKQVAEVA